MKDPFFPFPKLENPLKTVIFLMGLCPAIFLGACSELQNLRLIKANQDRRIEELETALEKSSSEQFKTIRNYENQVDSYKNQLMVTREELRKAQTQRTKHERELEKSTGEALRKLQTQTNEIERYQNLANARAEELRVKDAEIAAQRETTRALEDAGTSLTEQLNQSIADYNNLLLAGDNELKQQAQKIESLEADISSRDDVVSNLLSAVDSKDKTLAGQKAEIASLKKELEKESKKAGEFGENIKRLDAQIRKVDETLRKESALTSDTEVSAAYQREKLALEKEMLRLKKQIESLKKGETVMDSDFEDALNFLTNSLKPLGDADFATVTIDPRGVVVRLSADFLFKPDTVTLDEQVLPTLDQIADILAKYPDKYIEVQGHTDAQRIMNLPFVDNWALASARADKIVRHFAKHGKIAPKRLKSVSCAQFRPPVTGSAKARKMLRRVEIILTARP